METSPSLGNLTPSPMVGMKSGEAMSASEPKTAIGSGSSRVSIQADLYSIHDTRFDSMVFAHGKSGVWGGVFNYANVILGSGVVGMPYACK